MAALDIDYSLPDNSSDGYVNIYLSNTSGSLGSLLTRRSPSDPTRVTAIGLPDETAYWVTVRRVTDHVTEDSAQVKQFTKPPEATNIAFDDITGDTITVSWTDNATAEDGYRRLDSTDGGATDIVIGSDLAADTTSATWSALSRPDTHTLSVRTFIGSGSAEATADSTSTVERYLAPSTAPTGGATWLLEVEHSNNNVIRLTPNDASFTPRLNGLPTFEATVGFDERWLSDGFDDAALRVWKDGQRLPIDTLVSRPTSPGETTLRGRGGSQLRREADRVIDQNAVHDTVEQLVADRTDYATDVDDPDATTTPNTLIQEADTVAEFDTIVTSVGREDPLQLPEDGTFPRPAQTCFLFTNDGGDAPPNGQFTDASDGSLTGNNWEDSDVIELDSSGDFVEFEFDAEHDIENANLGVALRREYDDAGGDLDMRLQLDGTTLFDLDFGGSSSIGWGNEWNSGTTDIFDSNNPHTLRLEVRSPTASGAYFRVDVAAVFDKRYHTLANFPNQIETDSNEPGYLYLPGPAKYPDEVEFTTIDATPPVSVSGAELLLDVNNPHTAKQIELSGDSGSTYPISATDTESVSGSFASLVGQVRSRITLGAVGTGQSETPIDGFARSVVNDYDLFADLDDTPLFISENFQGSVLDVALDGGDYADAAWELQWDSSAGTQSFEWTQPGQRTSNSETDIADYSLERTTENRYDRIRVTGRSVPVADEAFTADHGTAKQLAEFPILPDSETVEGSTQTFQRGEDYTLDYEAGTITTLSTGDISDGQSLVISYRWQPLGSADRSGAASPFTIRKVSLPALSTDRECEIAARRIRDATESTLEEAEVSLPPDAIGLTAIDELQFAGLPSDETLEVNEISDDAGGQTARLGNRESVRDVVSDIRRKLSSTAENS